MRLPRTADGQPAAIAALLVRTGAIGVGVSSPAVAALIRDFEYDDDETRGNDAIERGKKKRRSKRELTRQASSELWFYLI